MTVFFIAYILTTAFAMIALLTGVITEHVTSVSQESAKADDEERFNNYVSTLEYVFTKGDKDLDGGLTFAELSDLLQQPEVASKIKISQANINEDDLADIFRSLDL